MANGARHSAAVAEFRHLCGLGLLSHELMPQMLRRLHDLIPSATNLFDWVDAEGRIVDYYTEPPYLPEVARRYFEEFYSARQGEVFAAFSAQTRDGRGVVRSPRSPQFYDSDFYRLIWRPRGVHHCLEGIVGDDKRPLGAVVLCRRPAEPQFTPDEEATLASLLPYLARAVKGPQVYRGARALAIPPALVVVNESGELRHTNVQARLRLALALHPCLNRRTCGADCSRADAGIAAQIGRLAAELRARSDGGATLQRTNQWGRFGLHAQWLEPVDPAGERLIGISIAHEVPLPMAIDAVLDRSPLSPRQRELCLLLAQGLTYAEIGERMDISEQTAISYARVVCEKLSAHGREDLLRSLLLPARDGPITPLPG